MLGWGYRKIARRLTINPASSEEKGIEDAMREILENIRLSGEYYHKAAQELPEDDELRTRTFNSQQLYDYLNAGYTSLSQMCCKRILSMRDSFERRYANVGRPNRWHTQDKETLGKLAIFAR